MKLNNTNVENDELFAQKKARSLSFTWTSGCGVLNVECWDVDESPLREG